jgi:hypothetical protein
MSRSGWKLFLTLQLLLLSMMPTDSHQTAGESSTKTTTITTLSSQQLLLDLQVATQLVDLPSNESLSPSSSKHKPKEGRKCIVILLYYLLWSSGECDSRASETYFSN